MAATAKDVFAERINRDAAKLKLDAQIAKLKADYEERGIGGRLADELSLKASAAIEDASDMAGESKGILAGTVALIAIWMMRNPILSAIQAALNHSTDQEGNQTDDYA